MKTICPYCKQEFPDTPDEYLETTVACSVCNKNFIAKKAKFCSECGAISPGQAIKCAQCGAFFASVSATNIAPLPMQNSIAESQNFEVEYDDDGEDCIIEEVGMLTAWKKPKFCGRSCRREYILFSLQFVVLLFLSGIAKMSPALTVVLGVIMLLMLTFYAALCVRRLHDIGLSGLWSPLLVSHAVVLSFLLPMYKIRLDNFFTTLLSFIVYSGLFLLLVILPSQPGRNKYGPNPVGECSDGSPYNANKLFLGIMLVPLVVMLALLIIGALT